MASVTRGQTPTNAITNARAFAAKSAGINGPRVLVADIETFPCIFYAWGPGKQNLGIEALHTDWSMMSFCGKWLGIDGVFYADNRYRAWPRDDFEQLLCVHVILSETDMVLAHNGKKFDMRKIRARLALNGFPPLAPIKVIDSYQLNDKAFGFTSQKLAYVSEHFGDQGKSEHVKFPGLHLWKQCEAGNMEAWEECREYNTRDVLETEAMYLKLRGWYHHGPNFGPYVTPSEQGKVVCHRCGSENVIKKGTRPARTQLGIYQRYKCNDCGAWPRGRVMIATREERAHILTD